MNRKVIKNTIILSDFYKSTHSHCWQRNPGEKTSHFHNEINLEVPLPPCTFNCTLINYVIIMLINGCVYGLACDSYIISEDTN